MKDQLFFQYELEDEQDLENMDAMLHGIANIFFLLKVSRKQDIAVYVSSVSKHPSAKECEYFVGDLPEDVVLEKIVDKMLESDWMKDMLSVPNPFQYDGEADKVVYNTHFNEKHLQTVNSTQSLISERLTNLTSYTPQKKPDVSSKSDTKDGINLLLDCSVCSKNIYIGVYNTQAEGRPVDFALEMREFSRASCIPEELGQKLEIYEQAEQLEDVYEIVRKERDRLNVGHNQDFAYGEIIPVYFIPLLDYVKPQPGEVFCDLGCGSGKPVFVASLAFPELKECRGIELLDALVDLG